MPIKMPKNDNFSCKKIKPNCSIRSNATFPEEKVNLLKELSRKPDIYERLARAIAPSIYENEDVKKGILLQLFAGTKKDFSNTGRGQFR